MFPNKLHLIFPFLVLLLCAGCKKEKFEPDSSNDPVFSSMFKFNEQGVSITAGDENYYMYSSFQQDTDTSRFEYVANLAKKDTSNCQGIRFIFNDKEMREEDFEDLLIESDLGYASPGIPFIYKTLSLASEDISTATEQIEWVIGGNTYNGVSPVLSFEQVGETFPEISVLLRKTLNGSTVEISKVIDLTSQEVACEIDYIVEGSLLFITEPSDSISQFTIDGTPLFSVDSLNQMDSFDLNNSFIDLANESHILCLEGTCLNPVNVCKEIQMNQNENIVVNRDVDFEFIIDGPFSTPNIAYEYDSVTIEYTDENCMTYSSNLFSQGANVFFRIDKSENYDDNIQGHPTKKLEVSYRCNLFDEQGDSYLLEGTATIAIAHP